MQPFQTRQQGDLMKTLAMIKMEKNFVAQEKGYPRQPYTYFNILYLLQRLQEETNELRFSVVAKNFENAKLKCADVSNIIDYIFEALQKETEK